MSDLIDRQAAIDALTVEYMAVGISGDEQWAVSQCIDAIKQLPSAQTEQAIKDCRNCKYGIYSDKFSTTFCYHEETCENMALWKPLVDCDIQSERKTGRWIPLQLSLEHPPYQCSCCFSNPPMIAKKDKWRKQYLEAVLSPYCPNCGAKMEVEHE